jgi:hypothetical protein
MCIRLRLILVEAATLDGRERGSINDITNTTTEIIQNTRKGRDRNFPRTAKSIVAPIAGTTLNMIIITAGRDITGIRIISMNQAHLISQATLRTIFLQVYHSQYGIGKIQMGKLMPSRMHIVSVTLKYI